MTARSQTLVHADGVTVEIRAATRADAAAIAALYNEGIAERQATFETRPREPDEIAAWFEPELPFLVAEIDGLTPTGASMPASASTASTSTPPRAATV